MWNDKYQMKHVTNEAEYSERICRAMHAQIFFFYEEPVIRCIRQAMEKEGMNVRNWNIVFIYVYRIYILNIILNPAF